MAQAEEEARTRGACEARQLGEGVLSESPIRRCLMLVSVREGVLFVFV